MRNERNRSISSQVVLGLIVCTMGVLFLLDNLDIFDFHRAIAFWPAVFILIGAAKLLDSSRPQNVVIGTVALGIGVIMTVNRLGYFHVDLRAFWPLMLVLAGGAVVYRALRRRSGGPSAMKLDEASDSTVDITAILGGFDRRITSPNFRGGEITALMGGCMLDLRGCSIEGEAVINVFAAMGGITMKVPPDWTVILHGSPIMGGFEEKTVAPPNNNKRLIVKGYAIMGAVEIRN